MGGVGIIHSTNSPCHLYVRLRSRDSCIAIQKYQICIVDLGKIALFTLKLSHQDQFVCSKLPPRDLTGFRFPQWPLSQPEFQVTRRWQWCIIYCVWPISGSFSFPSINLCPHTPLRLPPKPIFSSFPLCAHRCVYMCSLVLVQVRLPVCTHQIKRPASACVHACAINNWSLRATPCKCASTGEICAAIRQARGGGGGSSNTSQSGGGWVIGHVSMLTRGQFMSTTRACALFMYVGKMGAVRGWWWRRLSTSQGTEGGGG